MKSVKPRKSQAEEVASRKPVLSNPFTGRVRISILGTSPLVQRPLAATTVRKVLGERRTQPPPPRQFFTSPEGWHGIPTYGISQALRRAMIAMKVKRARRPCLVVIPDGFDDLEHGGLVRIARGEPVSGDDVLEGSRKFEAGWEAHPLFAFDPKLLDLETVRQAVEIAGSEVGIGAKRPEVHLVEDGEEPCYDYGTFVVVVADTELVPGEER